MGDAHLERELCIPTALELAVLQDRIHLPSCSAQHAGALLRSQHFCPGEAARVGARIRALLQAELLSFPPSIALSETERGVGMNTSRASLQPSILRGTELHAGSSIAILPTHSAPSGLLELLAPSSHRCHPHGPLRWGAGEDAGTVPGFLLRPTWAARSAGQEVTAALPASRQCLRARGMAARCWGPWEQGAHLPACRTPTAGWAPAVTELNWKGITPSPPPPLRPKHTERHP